MRLLLPFLVACTAPTALNLEEITAEALRSANEVVGATAISANAVAHLGERSAAVCPAVETEGSNSDFITNVDYGPGCTPAAMPAEMQGCMELAYANLLFDVAFPDLVAGDAEVDGWLWGAWGEDLEEGLIVVDAQLSFRAEETSGVTQSLRIATLNNGFAADGVVSVASPNGVHTSTLSDIVVLHRDLLGVCALPIQGSITVEVEGLQVELAFDEETPVKGIARASWPNGATDVEVQPCSNPARLY